MTLVEPSNIYFARMSNKTKLLLCNMFLYAHTKLFLYKWKLISLLAVNIYPSMYQFIVPSILMICENRSFFTHAVLPWTFSSVNTLPLNSLFITNQLMDDDFPASFNTRLHRNSWLQVFIYKWTFECNFSSSPSYDTPEYENLCGWLNSSLLRATQFRP
jgi:hypothetical protein